MTKLKRQAALDLSRMLNGWFGDKEGVAADLQLLCTSNRDFKYSTMAATGVGRVGFDFLESAFGKYRHSSNSHPS